MIHSKLARLLSSKHSEISGCDDRLTQLRAALALANTPAIACAEHRQPSAFLELHSEAARTLYPVLIEAEIKHYEQRRLQLGRDVLQLVQDAAKNPQG